MVASFKFLVNPVGRTLWPKQIGKVKRKTEILKRCYSDSGNILKSNYGDVKLPQMPFHEFIFENVGKWENQIAIECNARGKKYTYKELHKFSSNLAGSLQKKFNLKKGDCQCSVLYNSPEYMVVYLAASKAGVVTSPINPIYTAYEISYQIKITQPKLLFATDEAYEKCLEALNILGMKIPIVVVKANPEGSLPEGAVNFTEVAETDMGFNPVPFNPDDILSRPFSSGTTGLPKGVELTHRNITANLTQFDLSRPFQLQGIPEGDRGVVLAILPMFHIYGKVIVSFDSLRKGAHLVCLPKFEPKLFVETIYHKQIDILYLVPPLIMFLAHQEEVKEKHLKHVRHVASGAAPCGATDIMALKKKVPKLRTSQGYGMTETSPVISVSHVDRLHKLGSVGHPLSLTQVKIVDVSTQKVLPRKEHGEIRVKGPQVMKGYYKLPEETKEIFDEEGWLRTGDIGYIDEENDLFVVDRMKELIKVKGYQVPPAELEAALRDHPKIQDAGVVGIPDKDLGEVPRAFVVLKPGQSMKEEEVHDFIKERLASYKQLQGGVRFVKAIPKSAAGKILRRNLKDLE